MQNKYLFCNSLGMRLGSFRFYKSVAKQKGQAPKKLDLSIILIIKIQRLLLQIIHYIIRHQCVQVQSCISTINTVITVRIIE